MTRYHTGDRVEFAGQRGEVIAEPIPWGWTTKQMVKVRWANAALPLGWVMTHELTLIGKAHDSDIAHASTPFMPRIVAGTDMEVTA